MNDTNRTQPPAIKPASPWQLIRAIAKDTTARLTGGASIILLFFGILTPPNLYRDAVFILSGLSVVWAVYKVWADERNRLLSLSEEHRQLQQRASETSVALEVAQKANVEHLARTETLQREVARLNVRPFDEGQKAHAKSLIGRLDSTRRDLLRFLLLRGGSARADVLSSAGLMADVNLHQLSAPLVSLGLINRTEDPLSGYPTFAVMTGMNHVLRELLFPRDETNGTPYFEGIPVPKSR